MYIVLKGNHQYPLYTTSEGSFKYVLTFHENELMPACQTHFSNNFEELKVFGSIEWREPTDDDETDNDVLLIGN